MDTAIGFKPAKEPTTIQAQRAMAHEMMALIDHIKAFAGLPDHTPLSQIPGFAGILAAHAFKIFEILDGLSREAFFTMPHAGLFSGFAPLMLTTESPAGFLAEFLPFHFGYLELDTHLQINSEDTCSKVSWQIEAKNVDVVDYTFNNGRHEFWVLLNDKVIGKPFTDLPSLLEYLTILCNFAQNKINDDAI